MSQFIGFFDTDFRLNELSKQGDPLERLNACVDWELFRPVLEKALNRSDGSKGGRPPFDCVFMFKILFLQRFYHLSDNQIEYQIKDRLTFMRFLGLSMNDKVPDAKTIWLFRETLIKAKAMESLFFTFQSFLEEHNLVAKEGIIVDATFVEVPVQRNSRKENQDIKAGKKPESFEENPHKSRQKDIDARWTKKNGNSYFGYKNSIAIDKSSKFIRKFCVTSAEVHDSKVIDALVCPDTPDIWGDAAFASKEIFERLDDQGFYVFFHERAYRNKPLTEIQKILNHLKSKVRARVEHVFGHISNLMKGKYLSYIGIERITGAVTLCNLFYNMQRFVYLTRS
jgi:transposase, IS5 family